MTSRAVLREGWVFLVSQRSAFCVLVVVAVVPFGFDFVFGLRFVCSGDSLDYLVSAPLLYCSTKNHPALLRA